MATVEDTPKKMVLRVFNTGELKMVRVSEKTISETCPNWFPLEMFRGACDLCCMDSSYHTRNIKNKVQTMEDGWEAVLDPMNDMFLYQLCKASPKFAAEILHQLPYVEKDEANLCRVTCLMITSNKLTFSQEELDRAFKFFLEAGKYRMCQVYLALGADVDQGNYQSLLATAATTFGIDAVKFLIQCGASDVSQALFFAAHSYRFTPKESNTEARRLQVEEIMKVLIEAGAIETIPYLRDGQTRNSISTYHKTFMSTYKVLVTPEPFGVPLGYTFSNDFDEQSIDLAHRLFGKQETTDSVPQEVVAGVEDVDMKQ